MSSLIPEYRSWQMMKNRCLNPYAEDYAYYGGRGITIDPRWHKYANFIADMGPRPSLVHTLERVNNAVGYSKNNCVWATRKTQARNRSAYNKLNVALANQLRTDYATGKFRQIDLAAKFGITQAHVSQVIRRVIWG